MRCANAAAGRLLAAAIAAACAGCTLAPRYQTPASAPAAAAYPNREIWRQARPADGSPRGAWWSLFDDPMLDSLEQRTASANENLKAAFARLRQARAAARIARSGYFPQLSAAAAAARTRTSAKAPRFPAGAETVGNDFDVEGDLAYEIDVWGRVRSAVTAAAALRQASAADLATLDLAIHAELADDYYNLRGEEAEQVLLEAAVEAYAKAAQLTQALFDGGGAAQADVAQANAQLETTRTAAAEIRLQRVQTEHAIAVLLGQNPSTFRLRADPLPAASTPPPIDPGLPSGLLERRPDIAGAERRVAAANAEIGIARAAYFPHFSLAAAAGFNSTAATTWLQAPSRIWSLGSSGVLTLFDGGLRRAQTAQARARYDELVADYRNTVIVAYGEVTDGLAAMAALREESVSEAAAVTATGEALRQAQDRYREGAASYLEVAASQTAALQAEIAAVAIAARRMQASVQLIKALGGGWRDRPGAEARAADQ